MIENLNPVDGYSHLFIVTCSFSNFNLIIPLKSKTSAEVNQYMLYAILQPFKIEKLHFDNRNAFRNLGFLQIAIERKMCERKEKERHAWLYGGVYEIGMAFGIDL